MGSRSNSIATKKKLRFIRTIMRFLNDLVILISCEVECTFFGKKHYQKAVFNSSV